METRPYDLWDNGVSYGDKSVIKNNDLSNLGSICDPNATNIQPKAPHVFHYNSKMNRDGKCLLLMKIQEYI